MVLVMQTDASFWDSLVFDGIDDLVVEVVTAAFGTVDVVARGRAAWAACPDCRRFSDRVHDSYQRGLRELPLGEFRVVILLTVRRFICGSEEKVQVPGTTILFLSLRMVSKILSITGLAMPE